MTELKGYDWVDNIDRNILILYRYRYQSALVWFSNFGHHGQGITLKTIKLHRRSEDDCSPNSNHRFFHLTDEDVERMILPRII